MSIRGRSWVAAALGMVWGTGLLPGLRGEAVAGAAGTGTNTVAAGVATRESTASPAANASAQGVATNAVAQGVTTNALAAASTNAVAAAASTNGVAAASTNGLPGATSPYQSSPGTGRTVVPAHVDVPAKPPAKPERPIRGKVEERPLHLEAMSWAEKAYEWTIAGRLSVGASRSSSKELDETERPADRDNAATFIGYVNKLEPVDDQGLTLNVGYEVCPYFALQYTTDEVAARTRNYNNDLSDGVVRMSGPVYTGMLRIPIYKRIYPYVGISYAPWKGEFEHDEWWHLGWATPESYAAAGRPGTPTGMLRTIEVEDDTCQYTTYGVTVKLHRHVELDVNMRDMELNTPARFYHTFGTVRTLERTGDFPLSFKSYAVTLRMVF